MPQTHQTLSGDFFQTFGLFRFSGIFGRFFQVKNMQYSDDLFNFSGFTSEPPNNVQAEEREDDPAEAVSKKAKRRTMACTELSQRYEYRRAFSEVRLLEAMKYVELREGFTYNFITGGDVDALSFLKIVMNRHSLDYLLLSTWVMNAEDILQVVTWYNSRRIKKLDMYLGEIFPGSYRVEGKMIKDFYAEHPEAGRVAVFRNHSKIFAGYNESEGDNGFYFGIQSSANICTNPRTEQASITVHRGIFDFYKEFFDGIKSFEK